MKFNTTQYLYFEHYDILSIIYDNKNINFIFRNSKIYTENENFCTQQDSEYFIGSIKNYISLYKDRILKHINFIKNYEKIFIDDSYESKFIKKYHVKKYAYTNLIREFSDFKEALELCFNEQNFLKQLLKPIINELKIYKDELSDNLAVLNDIYAHVISIRNDKITKDIYILTLASTIFLPLNLVTGFFGMNTKGMFFDSFENGTSIVFYIIICIVILLISIWIIRGYRDRN